MFLASCMLWTTIELWRHAFKTLGTWNEFYSLDQCSVKWTRCLASLERQDSCNLQHACLVVYASLCCEGGLVTPCIMWCCDQCALVVKEVLWPLDHVMLDLSRPLLWSWSGDPRSCLAWSGDCKHFVVPYGSWTPKLIQILEIGRTCCSVWENS